MNTTNPLPALSTSEQDTTALSAFIKAWRTPRMIAGRYPRSVTVAYWEMCNAFFQWRRESETTE